MHFQGREDEVGDTESCANKDSCICQIAAYWLIEVVPSGQEGRNYLFDLGHSLDREEATN